MNPGCSSSLLASVSTLHRRWERPSTKTHITLTLYLISSLPHLYAGGNTVTFGLFINLWAVVFALIDCWQVTPHKWSPLWCSALVDELQAIWWLPAAYLSGCFLCRPYELIPRLWAALQTSGLWLRPQYALWYSSWCCLPWWCLVRRSTLRWVSRLKGLRCF